MLRSEYGTTHVWTCITRESGDPGKGGRHEGTGDSVVDPCEDQMLQSPVRCQKNEEAGNADTALKHM